MIRRHLTIIFVFLIIMVMTLLILLMSGPHMRVQPSIRSFEQEMPLPPEGAITFQHRSYTLPEEFPAVNDLNLKKGRVYYGYYCVFCHGDDGKGNGEVGKSYYPKPSEIFTDDISQLSNDELYNKMMTGVGHSPVMERVIPYNQRAYLVLFVKISSRKGR